jgi:2-methylisocitrate lyase-like PEP mutase family enzyme
MPISTADKRSAFRKMHQSGCFVLPNPWDIGSALALQHLGFKAVASTSSGYAWSVGRPDNRVALDDVLAHLTALCGAVDLPVNADFEGGFADEADKVAINVARAVKTGVAGLSIEDSTGDAKRRCKIGRLRSTR